jgi:HEAT repeat protein
MGLFGPPDVAKLKARGDVPGLIKALADDKDFQRRRAATSALGELADRRAVDALGAALKDPDEYVRPHAARALGKIGDPRAVEPLGVALKDPSVDVRVAAAKGLGEIGDSSAIPALLTALNDPSIGVRAAAARSLAGIGWIPDSGQTGEGYLLVQKRDWAACVTLGPAAVDPLLDALKRRDRHVRIGAAESLGKIRDPRSAKPLVAILGDPDPRVRQAARDALMLMMFLAEKPLVAALLDANPTRRRLAREILDRSGWSPDKTGAGASYWVATRQWAKCVEIGAPAVRALMWALEKDEDTARAQAAAALGEIGHPRAASALRGALDDPNEDVRRQAAVALGALYRSGKLNEEQKAAVLARGVVAAE